MHNLSQGPARVLAQVRRAIVVTLVFSMLMPTLLAAAERATQKEAQDLIAAVIALYDESGKEAAFAAIEDPNGGFIDRDLYVFVFGPEGEIVAHGADPTLHGTKADGLKDVDGVPFGRLFMEKATEFGDWVDYQWLDPVTRKIQPKSSWVVLHDGYVFGAGVYKP